MILAFFSMLIVALGSKHNISFLSVNGKINRIKFLFYMFFPYLFLVLIGKYIKGFYDSAPTSISLVIFALIIVFDAIQIAALSKRVTTIGYSYIWAVAGFFVYTLFDKRVDFINEVTYIVIFVLTLLPEDKLQATDE